MTPAGLHARAPLERIAALCDAAVCTPLPAAFDRPRLSAHLSRWGIEAQADDGIVLAQGRVDGSALLFAAQDERFLGGSVGAGHAAALRDLFDHARAERAEGVVLLLASGGVRLHEANPAELALAAAFRALLALRITGIPVVALGVGDVFGGASVLACAADRLGLLPYARLGLSGPRVIAGARGRRELDPDDDAATALLFGAAMRARQGDADLVADDPAVIRAWLGAAMAARRTFGDAVRTQQAALARRLRGLPGDAPAIGSAAAAGAQLPDAWREGAVRVDAGAGLWRLDRRPVWIAGAAGARHVSPQRVSALDAALLSRVLAAARRAPITLVLVEDSLGHEPSVAAERLCISRYLAHHAAVLALLRAAGVRLAGVLVGQGHSAAFFVHALQATTLHVLASARVVAMDPRNVARVTRLEAEALEACIARDPVLGQPAPLLAHWDTSIVVTPEADRALLESLVRMP